MTEDISEADARLALRSIDDQRQQVIAEIDVPRWYWWGLATAWVLLGIASDVGDVWVTSGATLVFGVVHSAVAQRVFSGRHKSGQLSVRAGVVGRHLPAVLFAWIIGLGAATVAIGFAVNADGAEHASTIAACFAAVAILCGGPTLIASLRARIARDTA
ncbi:MAG: hypothetical protein JWR83_3148 [Aeromicrobium sp.]|nr:hypothetical protein [Aeromicrobium sp.]